MPTKNYKLILILSIFILLFSSVTIQAAEYSLEELIQTGFEKNIEIQQLKNELTTIQRNIKLNRARSDWQANLSLDKELIEDDSTVVNRNGNEEVSVSLNKNFAKDKFTVSPNAYYDFDGSEVIYGVNMNLDLYPGVPSESLQNLINLNNQLNQKQKELFNKQAELAKSWIKQYLDLLRLDENIKVLEERLALAQDDYQEVQDQVEINEAGQQDLLQAEIDLNDAKFNLKQSRQNFKRLKSQLLSELQINKNNQIILSENNDIINRLQDLTEDLNIDELDKDKMVENVVKTSSQFARIINNKEYLKKELEWLKKDDAPQVSLQGSYDSESDFTASVNVSYNIFDSGVQEMTVENKKQEIENSELSLTQLYQQTENNIENLIDQVELAQLEKENSQLKYDKAVRDTEIIQQQIEAGAVEADVLKSNQLNEQNVLISLKQNEDDVFLNKLDLLTLTRPDDIVEEVTK